MKSAIVGTAGHIDHGKTALVKALTGIDADRLEEEKRRGITIDIGFAHLDLPGERGDTLRLGFVDVPGHERFVRNMLAGVGGIDLVLLVIAADEGIKPQTREHFDICRLLAIPRGITVLTKSDTVDAESLEVVKLEAAEFLRGSFLDSSRAPMVAVSAKTGAGLEELKRALVRVAGEAQGKDSTAIARLPIDRVFTMKGFGTVVTGTLISGSVKKEDELEVFPGDRRVRVRGVQVHGAPAERAIAGQRTALNLAGTAIEDLARGMTLIEPGLFHTTARADATLALLPAAKALRDRARVHFHCYSSETVAEVVLLPNSSGAAPKQIAPGGQAYAQLRFVQPMLLLPADRFIVRQFSPVVTIGGGVVIDNAPVQRKMPALDRGAILKTLAEGTAGERLVARVARRGTTGLALRDAAAESGLPLSETEKLAGSLMREIKRVDDVLVSNAVFDQLKTATIDELKKFHDANPLVAGAGKEELRERMNASGSIFGAVLQSLAADKKIEVIGEQVRAAGRGVVMKDEEAESKKIIEQAFAGAGLRVPALKEVLAGVKVDRVRAQKIVTLLLRDRVLVKLSDDLVFHRNALADLRKLIAEVKASSPRINVSKFKDLTGVSRKYAIPLLEYLDRERVTKRVGDDRVIL